MMHTESIRKNDSLLSARKLLYIIVNYVGDV